MFKPPARASSQWAASDGSYTVFPYVTPDASIPAVAYSSDSHTYHPKKNSFSSIHLPPFS